MTATSAAFPLWGLFVALLAVGLVLVVWWLQRGNARDREAFQRSLASLAPPPELPATSAAPVNDLAERVEVLESHLRAVKREMTDIGELIEKRHRSITGFISRLQRADMRGAEVVEEPSEEVQLKQGAMQALQSLAQQGNGGPQPGQRPVLIPMRRG